MRGNRQKTDNFSKNTNCIFVNSAGSVQKNTNRSVIGECEKSGSSALVGQLHSFYICISYNAYPISLRIQVKIRLLISEHIL